MVIICQTRKYGGQKQLTDDIDAPQGGLESIINSPLFFFADKKRRCHIQGWDFNVIALWTESRIMVLFYPSVRKLPSSSVLAVICRKK